MAKPSISAAEAKTLALGEAMKAELLARLRAMNNVHVYEASELRLMACSTLEEGTKHPRLYTPPARAHSGSVRSVEAVLRMWIHNMRENVTSLGEEYENAPVIIMIPSLLSLTYLAYRSRIECIEGITLSGVFQILLIRRIEFASADVYVDYGGYGKYQHIADSFKQT